MKMVICNIYRRNGFIYNFTSFSLVNCKYFVIQRTDYSKRARVIKNLFIISHSLLTLDFDKYDMSKLLISLSQRLAILKR